MSKQNQERRAQLADEFKQTQRQMLARNVNRGAVRPADIDGNDLDALAASGLLNEEAQALVDTEIAVRAFRE